MIRPAIVSNSSPPDALLSDYGNTCRLLRLPVGEIHARRSGLIAKAGRQFKQKTSVTNILSVLNKSTLKEASDMKRLLHSMTAASIAAGVALASSNPVGASDKQTPDSAQNTTVNEPSVLAQNVADEARGSTTAKVNIDSQGVILKGCDVVAYFKQRKPVKGDPAIKSLYQGATYLFASAANKADFDKDPAKYVPQYGGFCAYAVVKGILADLEGPDAFTVYQGKLYLGGNEDALRSFKNDIDGNIDKADSNWRRITGN
jgi:YHS domain-containing protein